MERELKQIADRVRRWRSESDLTLQELGARAGVSASTIHKIENSQTIPTITVLLKIANGLRRPPDELFDGERDAVVARMIKASESSALETQPGTRVHRIVAGVPKAKVDLWRVEHDPGTGAGLLEPLSYDGEVIVFVESGMLEVVVAQDVFVLEKGDTLHFKTDHPHSWRTLGDVTCRALFFGTLARFGTKPDLDEH